jgi:diguanylate cyclase (GGDEF)-like protein
VGDVASYAERIEHLVLVIQRLSTAQQLEDVQRIVRTAARRLAGADGATFVLRDTDRCYYVDEDAIEPLWKGKKFPIEACISGWSMLNKQAVTIPDIYQDARIPIDAYRPTFVKSLAMTPIRTLDPIGAIGTYWAAEHVPSDAELGLLRALADTTAVAIESVTRGQAAAKAHELSITDSLSGLPNRRAWDAEVRDRVAVAGSPPFAVALIDVDHFKQINDTAGHAAGDKLLRDAAQAWRDELRTTDVLARIGGDEFGVILERADLATARTVADRLATALPGTATCSVGVVAWDGAEGYDAIIARADEALYAAKDAGRGRAVAA